MNNRVYNDKERKNKKEDVPLVAEYNVHVRRQPLLFQVQRTFSRSRHCILAFLEVLPRPCRLEFPAVSTNRIV